MITCVQCQKKATVRAGWMVTGQGWQEADYCDPCMRAAWEKAKSAVASNKSPPWSFGPAGIPIHWQAGANP